MRQNLIASVVVATLMTAPAARAAQYLMTVHSTFLEDDSSSDTFDGTTHGTLPFLPLDNARLAGGTMVEHFIISDVTPATTGSSAFYDLAPSADWTYDLYDPSGALVHHGSGSLDGSAIIENNEGGAPYTVDQALIFGDFSSVTNLNNPTPGMSVFLNTADISCFSYVGNGVDFLSDLSVPLDAATYASFPAEGKITDILVAVGSGDTVNFADPYAYAASQLVYSLDSVSIVAIPEPSEACLLGVGVVLPLSRCRRSR